MGLYWWHKSRLLLFDERHGLPEEALANLADDASGDLWCAANGRLFRLRKKELEAMASQTAAVLHPLVVGRSSGLTSIPFATGISARAVRGPDGRLFFPRAWDVISFNPADFETAEPAPTVLIEEVFADGRKLEASTSTNGPLQIAARTGEIAVRYTALQCVAPETVQFRYRFDGADEDWTEAGGQRVVNFRHLPPGPYRFRVSASAAGAAWTEPGASLAFTILPAWYQTWWFRTLAGAGIAGLLFATYARRVARLEQARLAEQEFSRRLMQSQEQERQRLAAELHDSVGQNLVVIKNRAQMALDKSTEPGKMVEQITAVSNMASEALREVRGMAQDLRPFQLDEMGLSRAIVAMTRRLADSSGIQFHTDVAELNGELPKDREIHFYRIVQELLTNIIKHSRATEANVTIRKAGQVLRALIQDNGCGFDAGGSANQPLPQAGFGLRGIRERVRTLAGHLQIDSRNGDGTTVVIEVPTGVTK